MMNDQLPVKPDQLDMFGEQKQPNQGTKARVDESVSRTIIDQLLTQSKLYRTSKDYKALLDFIVQLKPFAPFNALLLQIQKPGLSFAASAFEWWHTFGRRPKAGARPLLILWPFGPVALVYDVLDTEGRKLPKDVNRFIAHGQVNFTDMAQFEHRVIKSGIDYIKVDAGDRSAGEIMVVKRSTSKKDKSLYRIHINKNHKPAVQFCTLAHELGHLFLGHLGVDPCRKIPKCPQLNYKQRELEAESVAYIICKRHGVESKSETYLSNFVAQDMQVGDIDIYRVTRAAGEVERVLGIAPKMRIHDGVVKKEK